MKYCEKCGCEILNGYEDALGVCNPCGIKFCCMTKLAVHFGKEHPDVWDSALSGENPPPCNVSHIHLKEDSSPIKDFITRITKPKWLD